MELYEVLSENQDIHVQWLGYIIDWEQVIVGQYVRQAWSIFTQAMLQLLAFKITHAFLLKYSFE